MPVFVIADAKNMKLDIFVEDSVLQNIVL